MKGASMEDEGKRKLDQLMARAQAGQVTHEELVDVMRAGVLHHGGQPGDAATLLAMVRHRFPTNAEVSAFVLQARALLGRAQGSA
jgi:predicted Zn-dependent protease